jgi:fructose-1,6-bisphosphatase
MDPIDGSKNIYASLPVGSIFGIYKAPPGKKRSMKHRFCKLETILSLLDTACSRKYNQK